MKNFILLCGIGLSVSPFADGQQPTIAVDRATRHELDRIEAHIDTGDRERALGLRDARLQARAHRHFEAAEHDYRDAMGAADRWSGEHDGDAAVVRAMAPPRTAACDRLERVLLDDANLMLAAGRTVDALRDADAVLAIDPGNAQALAARRDAALAANFGCQPVVVLRGEPESHRHARQLRR